MKNILSAESLKYKRTPFYLVALLYPFIIIAAVFLVFMVSKGDIAENYDNLWNSLIITSHFVTLFVVPISIPILVSTIINIEHESNSWKMLMSLPLSRSSLYWSKLYKVLYFSLISSFILFLGLILMGLTLSFNENVPFMLLLKEATYPFIGSFPIITFQLWISIRVKNQAFPIAIGVLGAIAGFFLQQMGSIGSWIFWAYPSLLTPIKQSILNGTLNGVVPNEELPMYMFLSVLFGLIFLGIGLVTINRKEIA